MLFSLGKVVSTPGAVNALEDACVSPFELLLRHQKGDWGDIHPGDRGLNERALLEDMRILSVYPLKTNKTVWVITEWDRSLTTLLLPEEY